MIALLRIVLVVSTCLVALVPLRAQTHEERVRTILQLFEAGQRDTAYRLIEPLKREARFVPVVLWARALMTPDDRALNLYREMIALEPQGEWADDAVHQLVVRYVEKKDSEAAHIWAGVLRRGYPKSPFVAEADSMLAGVESWEMDMPGPQFAEGGGRPNWRPTPPGMPDSGAARPRPSATGGKGGPVAAGESGRPTETISASGMRGYALQVGLFPTREVAEKQAAQLAKKKLKALPLPKTVNGRKLYALVVGPYPSIEAATKKKPEVSELCGCQSFIVKVE